MIRIQLHLSEVQDRKLRALARRRGTVRAELIRRGIDLLLQQEAGETDALLDLVDAAGPAGRADASEQHDAILYVRDTPRDEYAGKKPARPRGKRRDGSK